MTSDTGAVARIVDGLREIVERLEAEYAAAKRCSDENWDRDDDAWGEECALNAARQCLAVAEAQR